MDELPINWTYPEIQPKLLEEARKRGFLPKKDEIKWLFFDVGSTLVDESKVYEDRMKRIAEISGLTYEQIYKYAMSFYKGNKKELVFSSTENSPPSIFLKNLPVSKEVGSAV